MKINVTITSAEAAYIRRAISRIAPNFDQTEMWQDIDEKYPAFRSTQSMDSNGNIDAGLDINSDFIMDLTDVCAEVAEKAKGFAFMLKGAWEGVKQYGKDLVVRFNKWMPEVDAQAEAEAAINHCLSDEDRCGIEDGSFSAVIVNTDKDTFMGLGKDPVVRSHTTHNRSWADLQESVKRIEKSGQLGSNPTAYYFIIDGDRAVSIDPEQIFGSLNYKMAYREARHFQEQYATDGRPIEEGEMIAVSDKGIAKVFDSYELDDACTKLIADVGAEYIVVFTIKGGNLAYVCNVSGKVTPNKEEK